MIIKTILLTLAGLVVGHLIAKFCIRLYRKNRFQKAHLEQKNSVEEVKVEPIRFSYDYKSKSLLIHYGNSRHEIKGVGKLKKLVGLCPNEIMYNAFYLERNMEVKISDKVDMKIYYNSIGGYECLWLSIGPFRISHNSKFGEAEKILSNLEDLFSIAHKLN